MWWLYVLLFFLFIALLVFLAIYFLEQEDVEKFAEDMAKKRMDEENRKFNKNVFYKRKEEDITDL